MDYNFFMPTRIIQKENCVLDNSRLFPRLGKKCLIIISGSAAKRSGALSDVETALKKETVEYQIHDTVEQNPMLLDAFEAGKKASKMGAEFIIGIGGGSPLDACKVVALYATNPMQKCEEIYDRNWKEKPLPIVAIGTTAGTGSEVTQYSVMTTPEGRKQTVTTYDFFPTITFADAKYTHSLPLSFTISTALDALAHAMEGYFSRSANNFSDLFAQEAIITLNTALSELKDIKENGGEVSAKLRDQLYYASLNGGITISRTGTTYCHSLGYFMTEEHNIPHGIACAVYLPGFIKRAKQVQPDKAEKLEHAGNLCLDELAKLVEELVGNIDIELSSDEMKNIAARYENATGLTAVAPNGLSVEEAAKIMGEIFAK